MIFFPVLAAFCSDDITSRIGMGFMNNAKIVEKKKKTTGGFLPANYLSKKSVTQGV